MKITLAIPDELAGLLDEVEERLERAVIIEAVCGLYSRGRVPSAKAARLLGFDRWQFQQELNKRLIPLQYTREDLDHDLAFARGQ